METSSDVVVGPGRGEAGGIEVVHQVNNGWVQCRGGGFMWMRESVELEGGCLGSCSRITAK